MKKVLFLLTLLTFQLVNCYSQRNTDIRSENALIVEMNSEKNLAEKTFLETLNAHLTAIQNHDLEGYIKTISSKNDIIMIMPNAQILNNRDSIISMHQEWFASKTWVFNYTIEQTTIKNDFAIALLSYNYQDIDEQGKPYAFTSLLSLIFENQDGIWRLIYDQNTRKK